MILVYVYCLWYDFGQFKCEYVCFWVWVCSCGASPAWNSKIACSEHIVMVKSEHTTFYKRTSTKIIYFACTRVWLNFAVCIWPKQLCIMHRIQWTKKRMKWQPGGNALIVHRYLLLLLLVVSGHRVFAFNIVFMTLVSNEFPSHMPMAIHFLCVHSLNQNERNMRFKTRM